MDVARDHNRVVGPGGGEQVEEAGPGGGVAVPLVEVVQRPGQGHGGGHDLVGQHVPRSLGLPQAPAQPGLLLGTQQGALGGRAGIARRAEVRRPAGLVAAVLAGVQHVEPGQPSPVDRPIDAQVRAGGRRQTHRLVLPPGLVGGGAACRERRGLGRHLGQEPGVVVLDLVVVPGHDPRAGGMDALQRRVALVEAIAVAVGVQRRDLGAVVLAHRGGVDPALVDVVAEMDHQVGVLMRREGPRRPEAVLPVLARREQEAQAIAPPPGGRRSGSADRADLVSDAEAVEVPGVVAQVAHVDVNRVRKHRRRRGAAGAHDPPEVLVAGHLPADRHVAYLRHPAPGERLRCEAGPQHDAARDWIPRRHAQREQPAREVGARARGTPPVTGVGGAHQGQRQQGAPGAGQETPTRDSVR